MYARCIIVINARSLINLFKRESSRKEAVINKMRLMHTKLTHGYTFEAVAEGYRLLRKWLANEIMIVKHILIICLALTEKVG